MDVVNDRYGDFTVTCGSVQKLYQRAIISTAGYVDVDMRAGGREGSEVVTTGGGHRDGCT
jgi:hypothetical protein